MAAAADLRESLRQRARTQVHQERTLSPTSSAAAPDEGDSSMDDALADFKKKAAAGRTRRASISIGGGSIGAGRTRSASLSPAEVSAAQQPTQLDSFAAAVLLLCRCCALLCRCSACRSAPCACPLTERLYRARITHGEDL